MSMLFRWNKYVVLYCIGLYFWEQIKKIHPVIDCKVIHANICLRWSFARIGSPQPPEHIYENK